MIDELNRKASCSADRIREYQSVNLQSEVLCLSTGRDRTVDEDRVLPVHGQLEKVKMREECVIPIPLRKNLGHRGLFQSDGVRHFKYQGTNELRVIGEKVGDPPDVN